VFIEALNAIWEIPAQNPNVKWFRNEVLHGRLLARDEVEEWIKQKAEEDGPHTVYLRVPVPSDKVVHMPDGRGWIVPNGSLAVGASVESLEYSAPTKEWVQIVVVSENGVLGWLRVLSKRLARTYGWKPYQATVFVLTDVPPLLPRAELRDGSSWSRARGSLHAIRIEVHDPFLSPRTVMEMYRKARAKIFPGRRYRRMSTKHISLAQFYGGEKSKSWADLMKEWNRAYPEWTYDEERNFSRDSINAWSRVTQ
jgi:hypothetical protein